MLTKNIWIISVCWDYEGGNVVAVTDNKRAATAIMNKCKSGDYQIIEKFPVLKSVKDLPKEEPWK